MKITKQIAALALAGALMLSAVGCSNGGNSTESVSSNAASSSASAAQASSAAAKTNIRIVGLKGPTGLSMVKLMSDSEAKKTAGNYTFTLVSSADEAVSKIVSGEADTAAVPTNLAAVLYNKTKGKVQLAAVTTLGVLSIVTNGENIKSIKDLKGKTVVSSGQGAIPEYAFNYILKQNGLEPGKDVKIEYKAQHAEVATAVIAGKVKIAVLPEPFVTQVTVKNKNIKVALNMTDEWKKATKDASILTMGALIVQKNFAEKNKGAFNTFLDEYKASAQYSNSNVADAAKLSEKYGIMASAVAKKAIPNCSIVYLDGDEMKTKVPDFLKILYQANPKSVGGTLPGDDLYYKK